MPDKENISKRTKAMRKSCVSSKQVLLNSETANSSELTNEFAGYLDYVRTLQGDNEILKAEKEKLLESCNNDILLIKSTYGGEIDALRKALDESTKEKCTTDYHNDKLLEENSSLKIKFARKIDALKELEKKYEDAEASLIKNRRCAEQFESIHQEHDELTRYNSLLNEQLKTEISMRTVAESRVQTLNDEVEFFKRVNANNVVSRDNSAAVSHKSETYYSEKFDNEMKALRDELTDEFDLYKEEMEEAFSQKLEELSLMNAKAKEKSNKIYDEKKLIQNENETLLSEIATMENKMAAMSARDTRHKEMVLKINEGHDNFIRDLLEENTELKNKAHDMSLEVTRLTNEKIANDKETYIFRSMLKGEQSRVNIADINSPKRRRVDNDNDNEISAWSKDGIKIFCDANYNGNYIQLMNDGVNETSLNEWKIELDTQAGSSVMFTFPPMTLAPGNSLKVWSEEQSVVEDECNMVMNIALPSSDIMACRLTNDMDEIEASFDLKRSPVKRKILKAKKGTDNEKCSLM